MAVSKQFEELTDEELIERYRQGELSVMEYLLDKYKLLVRKEAKNMFLLGADSEDLIQEGMVGLFKAVRDYDCGRDASFYTFAKLCITRQMYTAVEASKRDKHIPLNNYISISISRSEEDEDGEISEDRVREYANTKEENPEQLMLDKERLEDLEHRIDGALSPFEKQVLDLYIIGNKTSEIAKVLGREEKATDNALQRLKGKIRKLID